MSEKESIMVEGAKNALDSILNLKPNEPILIVTDEVNLPIANAFDTGGRQLDGTVKVYQIPEDQRPLKEVPADFTEYLEHCREGGIIINLITANSSETPFRIKLIKSELTTKARIGHAPGITLNMMTAVRSMVGMLVQIGVGIWLFVLARRKNATPWVWLLFGLCFGISAAVLFFIIKVYEAIKSTPAN